VGDGLVPGFEPRHPGDAKDLPSSISKAPTDAQVVAVRDVILIPTTYVEDDSEHEVPAGDEPLGIADETTIERISHADAELILNACTHRGHYFFGVRQFGQRYSFVRRVELDAYEPEPYAWDERRLLFFSIFLSRLIHDNGHSLEYAARLVDHEDGLQQVIPAYAPSAVATFRLRRDRDWLTAEEAGDLRQLLTDFLPVKDALPWKVVHALNLSEEVVHVRILQRALLLLAIGLEGLVQSASNGVAKQFRERLPSLADEVGVDGVDEGYAQELYARRSEAAHGAPVSAFRVRPQPEAPMEGEPGQPEGEPEPPQADPGDAAFLAKAQDLIRAITRKAIQDSKFREAFESPESVAAQWPVEV
jgi:hypothetical protein